MKFEEIMKNMDQESIKEIMAKSFKFNDFEGFDWKFNQEGVRDFAFGTKLGPINTVQAIIHDLAHAVEFGAKNFHYRGRHGALRFNTPSRFVINRMVCEPETGQITEREARTQGIELRLFYSMGLEFDPEDFAQECVDIDKYLPDCYFYSKKQDELKSIIISTFENTSEEYVTQELKRWFLCARRAKKYAGQTALA